MQQDNLVVDKIIIQHNDFPIAELNNKYIDLKLAKRINISKHRWHIYTGILKKTEKI